ncbi:uncharacterized protein LOC129181070 [Dunckerocampus dactyliophorus]|uniref:uncharacterized protein LOC129181070 n=1 Tax=Dunckerocampus dactyliophorus TaxID=161453 RepID=UPI0024072D0E|nr:uncharacterized protein LOC129181070 [Dunckerocampus dactyliophorus]
MRQKVAGPPLSPPHAGAVPRNHQLLHHHQLSLLTLELHRQLRRLLWKALPRLHESRRCHLQLTLSTRQLLHHPLKHNLGHRTSFLLQMSIYCRRLLPWSFLWYHLLKAPPHRLQRNPPPPCLCPLTWRRKSPPLSLWHHLQQVSSSSCSSSARGLQLLCAPKTASLRSPEEFEEDLRQKIKEEMQRSLQEEMEARRKELQMQNS